MTTKQKQAADSLSDQVANVISKLSVNQLETRTIGELVLARDAYEAAAKEPEPDGDVESVLHHCNKCGGSWMGSGGSIIHPGCLAKHAP